MQTRQAQRFNEDAENQTARKKEMRQAQRFTDRPCSPSDRTNQPGTTNTQTTQPGGGAPERSPMPALPARRGHIHTYISRLPQYTHVDQSIGRRRLSAQLLSDTHRGHIVGAGPPVSSGPEGFLGDGAMSCLTILPLLRFVFWRPFRARYPSLPGSRADRMDGVLPARPIALHVLRTNRTIKS